MQTVSFFHALGDPTRLEIVKRLATEQQHSITTLTRNLPITRQGARKHLKILEDAKIISLNPKGKTTEVYLLRDTLDQGKSFIASLELQWDNKLKALRDFVEKNDLH
jgi:DNA-binding transcriptional ArsR family regulator